ncbi:sensor histidine kinase [Allostreptomyces psammosilenae]|uniref:histidine kinase n=1 Tax=Allostreptomyces psammosilenae TaxID=1892865 RepID=A0A852ZKZ9_9ACTN|nr:HAMP domain-containing sensor histidine kinase [Allostreptomyces psammosilenae]NYI03083.1 signal transduction histidine kinase [Allostreptomyces psammosilenae]
MRVRLLGLLIFLMACVLLALGVPLAASQAAAQQQRVVVDRLDDTARFAGLALYSVPAAKAGDVGRWPATGSTDPDGTGAMEGTDDQDAARRIATLRDELRRYGELYGIRAGIFDRNQQPVAISDDGYRVSDDPLVQRAFGEALSGRRSHDPPQVWPWQDDYLVVASPVVRDGDVVAVVLTESPTDGMRARVRDGWLVLAAGESVAMLAAVALAVQLTRWVLRPVRVLDATAHRIATGRFAARVPPSGGPPELRRLTRAFNEMADHVEDAFERQRAFVADASHQLRNPLAALMLRIEVLGMDLPPHSEEEFAKVREEYRRLARVVDDILGLATAEGSTRPLRPTDVAELVAERLHAWEPAAADARVRLLPHPPEPAAGAAAPDDAGPVPPALLDAVAFGSALDAVLDNAVKYTPAGSEVRVWVDARDGRVRVTVADSGPGLSEEEIGRAGDRFWRSPRHQNTDGSGLGLSIARALLVGCGGGLDVTHNTPHGLRVTLWAPRAERPVKRRPPAPVPPPAPAPGLPAEPAGAAPERGDQGLTDR